MNNAIPKTDWGDGFLSGLVCGEGNFTIAIAKAPSCRLGYHVRPIFQVEMAVIDEPLVRAVRGFFGFGSISFPAPRTRTRNESPTIRYSVTAVADCVRLETFFRANPLVGAKGRAFNVWSQCLVIIRGGRHTTTSGFREIVTLRSGINQFRRPSTFRSQGQLNDTASIATDARPLAVWSDQEIGLVRRYLAGDMSRPELIRVLGRTTASVANQIKRIRGHVFLAGSVGHVSAATVERYIAEQKGK